MVNEAEQRRHEAEEGLKYAGESFTSELTLPKWAVVGGMSLACMALGLAVVAW